MPNLESDMKKVIIKNIKHVRSLEFEIPHRKGVYILTGSNGSGKTTLMTCLLRIGWYRAFQDNFKTGNDRIDDYEGEVIYEVDNERVSYHHAGTRWPPRPRSKSRLFEKFDFPQVRFLPATGNRLFIHEQNINPTSFRAVSQQLKTDLNSILETDKFNNLRFVQTGSTRGRGGGSQRWKRAYVIKIKDNKYYSEKNFSLGEILVLNTLLLIEDVPNRSMLLIDELEMALHPRVQIRLLNYLEQKADEKELTVILSTHSSSIIKCGRKIIYLENDGSGDIKVDYNAYPALVLKEVAIEEDIQPDYVFLVEDDMAELLLKETLNFYFQTGLGQRVPICKILPIGGYPQLLAFAKHSKDYLFNSRIGQYVFPDKDVEEKFKSLRQKGNNRDEPEQKLFDLFKNLSNRTNYLPITPELGLWEWMNQNPQMVQNGIDQHYQGVTFNITDLISQSNDYYANEGGDIDIDRKKAKRRVKYLVKLISNRVNESPKRVNQFLFSIYVNHFYGEANNQNELKGTFGSIFSKRGN